MKCTNCGFEVSEDNRFCGSCGSLLKKTTTEEEHESERAKDVKPFYCRNCGKRQDEGAVFCTNCGKPLRGTPRPGFEPTDWGKRFIAWLIDIVILGFFLAWFRLPGIVLVPELSWVPFLDLGSNSLVRFVYWFIMEGIYGQSLGKMVMKIKVTKIDGKPLDLLQAAIESIGKAFLLPIDCLIGWILYPNKKQRLFNYLSETIVVKS